MPLIYCVEDDAAIRELITYAVGTAGFTARGFESGADFFAACKEEMPALALLDIMLPGQDGIAILKRLRAEESSRTLPVIMVTAKTGEFDKVKGLDLGADDYIAKPFGVMELLSRIKAVLRRSAAPEMDVLEAGTLRLDLSRREASVAGVPCKLTYKEFELLHFLAKNRGHVLTREQILLNVWGYDFEGETRTVDVHVKTLRQKLLDDELISTVRSVGYMLK